MADDKKEIDNVTGVETTGHEWDGLKELNNPLPKWWLYTFYATIVWTVGYTVAYPAWPMLTSATTGMLGWSSRGELAAAIAEDEASKATIKAKIASMDVSEIAKDPELVAYADASGAATFRTYCSQCHGSGALGAKGYPNLQDDDWLWGGTPDAIHHTIKHGIRVTDAEGYALGETRDSQMPAFGDDYLETEEITSVVEYVLKLSGQEHDAAKAGAGEEVFLDNCASCHGDEGGGMVDLGAPNLSDAAWLYGGDRETLIETVTYSRAGMMPAWGERLDDAAVKSVALYIHRLGGGVTE